MGRVCAALIAAAAVLIAPPGAAWGAWTTSVSMYSDPGDFIGDGEQRVWHPGNSTEIRGIADGDGVNAWADFGPEQYSFMFAPPRGQALEPRNYLLAQRLAFRADGHPGLDVEGMSRACNELDGRFELLDVAIAPDGSVERLWAIYEQHCEFATAATWGEVRINAWVPDAQAHVAPGIVRWPELDAWETATPVPVTYTGGAAVTDVAIGGPHAGDFAIVANGCAGRAGPCDVTVRFDPAAGGTRHAALRFTDAAGVVHEALLQGFRHAGTTNATFDVLEGDLAGQPGTYAYGATDGFHNGGASFGRAGLHLAGDDDRWWLVQLYAGPGAPLTPGGYDGEADIYAPYGPGINADGSPTGCNRTGGSYTVHEITHLPDETLRTLDVSFEMRCYEDERPALRGRWRFRAGSDEPVAPWLVPGPRPRIDPPPRPAPPAPGEPPPASGGGTTTSAPAPTTVGGGALAAALRADGRTLRARCPPRVERLARVLDGGARAERLIGRAGMDLILAGPGDDVVFARGGSDCVAAGEGDDRVHGGSGADVVMGQEGDDRLAGANGPDVVRGGGGDDLLVGGPGRDVLDCGPGASDRAVAGRRDRTRGCERVARPKRRR